MGLRVRPEMTRQDQATGKNEKTLNRGSPPDSQNGGVGPSIMVVNVHSVSRDIFALAFYDISASRQCDRKIMAITQQLPVKVNPSVDDSIALQAHRPRGCRTDVS
jgi:hypothetical protein